MEISYIDEFIALANTKKYSAAARQLHITQPTLTRHIQTLENELGYTLFTRTTRDIDLSGFGKIFLPYAKKMSSEFHSAQEHLAAYERKTNQTLQLGIVHNPDLYHIIDFVMDFQHSHPNVSIHFTEAPLQELHTEFLSGSLNIITLIYAQWENIPSNFIPAGKSRLVAVLPKDHPMASCKKLSLACLENEKLMVPEKTNFVYRYLNHVLKEENIQPDIFYQGNTSGISNLLKKHHGILIQDYYHALTQLDESLLLKELEPDIYYTFGWEYKNVLTKNELAFIQYAKKTVNLPIIPIK